MVYQDVIRPRKDVRTYRVNFLLWKEQWDAYIAPPIPLNWKCVKFEENNAAQIPTEKGIYAFVIEPRLPQFPSHGYVTYIGETGHNSNRNLRKRFGFPLLEFVKASDNSTVVKKYRHPEGGSVLFRPIGLNILTEIIAALVKRHSLPECFQLISKLPTDLTQEPYNRIIWHPTQRKIIKGKTLARNLLLYMLDHPSKDVERLHETYAKALGLAVNQVELPKKAL